MKRNILRNLLTTSEALILVILSIDVTYTKLELKVPVLCKSQCITLSDTAADKAALISMIGKF